MFNRVWKFFYWLTALMGTAVLLTTAIVLTHYPWRRSFVDLLWRSASNAITSTSHTWLGVLALGVAAPVVKWSVTFVHRWSSNKRRQVVSPLRAAFDGMTSPTQIIEVGIVVGVWLVLFGCFIVKSVYDDHQGLVKAASVASSPLGALTRTNEELNRQLEFRKHFFVFDEPSSQKLISMFAVFAKLRRNLGQDATGSDIPCFIRITAPNDSLKLASNFAGAMRVITNCQVADPKDFRGDSDAENKVLVGASDRAVILRASRNSKFFSVTRDIDSQWMFLTESYDSPDTWLAAEDPGWVTYGHANNENSA